MAGMIRYLVRARGDRRKTLDASCRRKGMSLTPIAVWNVIGTITALITTTNFSDSSIPNHSMNRGTHASVGTWAKDENIGRTSRSTRRLRPISVPNATPASSPDDNPITNRRRLIRICVIRSSDVRSRAEFHTTAGEGSTWLLTQSFTEAICQRANRHTGNINGVSQRALDLEIEIPLRIDEFSKIDMDIFAAYLAGRWTRKATPKVVGHFNMQRHADQLPSMHRGMHPAHYTVSERSSAPGHILSKNQLSFLGKDVLVFLLRKLSH